MLPAHRRGSVITHAIIHRDAELERAAAALYDDRLPYHNLAHALETIEASRPLLERCRRHGIAADPEIVYLALLFHDAGYQDDHHARGFGSKEAWAAELAGKALGRHPYPPARIAAVQAAIRSTEYGVPCQTVEARIVKAADLAGLAADYELFLQNSGRLWREQILLSGAEISWPSWRAQAVQVLARYMADDLGFSPACYAEDGETWLAKQARENIERLRKQLEPA